MPHRSHLCTIVIDVPAPQHADAVRFWSGATGTELVQLSYAEYHGGRLHPALALLVQRIGAGEPRVHLDFHTDDVDREVDRLVALGATIVERLERWTIMADPSGQVFCVVLAPDGTLDVPGVVEWP